LGWEEMMVDALLLVGRRSCVKVKACTVVVVSMAARGSRRSRQEEEDGRRLRRHEEAAFLAARDRGPGASGMARHCTDLNVPVVVWGGCGLEGFAAGYVRGVVGCCFLTKGL
jgi:hypothetical protein